MIKVIQFIHGFNMGGAETLVKDYALLLDAEKIDLNVLCLEKHNSPWDKTLNENGIKVIYINEMLKYKDRMGIFFRIINGVQRLYLIKKVIKGINPDIIHQHLTLSKYLIFAKPKRETCFVYTQHFDVSRLTQNYKFDIWATKKLIKKYKSLLIALNPEMQKDLKNVYKNTKCVIVNNGIDITRFYNVISTKEKRLELGIPENAFLIGHVGRFTAEKNHEFLLDIFWKISKKKSKAYLLLIGDGELFENINAKIKKYGLENRVIILSKRTDIPELMHMMDVFVFPSVSEGLPLSCIEAQVAGTQCLVSDVVSKKTRISNLIVYKSITDSASSWADVILNFQKKKPEYYNIEKWDIRNVVLELEDIYEKLKS